MFNQWREEIPTEQHYRYKYTDDEGERYRLGGYKDRTKYYLKNGRQATDTWIDINIINKNAKERTGYPTQKPLALLERIIKASSKDDDIVLDPFCGCATTCVAAQQLGRRWIGIDVESQSAKLVADRLSDNAGLFKDFIHRKDIPQRTDVKTEMPNKDVKERLYAALKGVCNGCGNHYLKKDFRVDHIIPKNKGGGDYYENYQLLCGHCNGIKGNRPMDYLRDKIKRQEEHLRRYVTFGE